jgi:hypothetical protein
MPRLVQLVSRAPPKLLKELGNNLVSLSFLRVGFKTNMFPRNERGGLRVSEFFHCVCQFVLNSDRESRAQVQEYFPLLVEKEYRPFESESPLARIVLENMFREYFMIPSNAPLPTELPVDILKAMAQRQSLTLDPSV